MALEVTVGPPRLAINQGYGVLITDHDGQIRWPTDKGFYHSDTRVISSWRIFADGALRAAQWLIGKKGVFTMRDVLGFDDAPPKRTRS